MCGRDLHGDVSAGAWHLCAVMSRLPSPGMSNGLGHCERLRVGGNGRRDILCCPRVAAAFWSCGPALAGLAQEHSTADRGAHSAETSDEGIRCRASGVDVVYEQHLAST